MKPLIPIFLSITMLLTSFSCSRSSSSLPDEGSGNTIVFTRVYEPREKAFSLLIPKGWQTDGGILRVDPLSQGGAAQSIAAKLDFTVKKDSAGTVLMRWLPDMLYFDSRYSPAGQMGLLPAGSNYNGMLVYPLMPASQFITQMAFPYAHPQAQNVNVVSSKALTEVARSYQKRVNQFFSQMGFQYDAALSDMTYQEAGTEYEEKMVTVIENWGQLGAGMWGNKETVLVRAPRDEFKKWEAVFSIIQNSVKIDPQWLSGEIRGQIQRGQIALNTQQEIQRIEQEIVTHRQKTNAEIHNDMFLTLTDQEEFVNPYTNEIDMGSNQWKYRWVNESGDVIYTDNGSYNPNVDIHLNRSDYKKTPIRKRFPQ
ncbi:MAG TPA: hypothetical protein PLT76_09770 [Candidatus Omnitrophota bacterium]|nr:hypothetical protein [Candidatus Omnitrophota bacterium]